MALINVKRLAAAAAGTAFVVGGLAATTSAHAYDPWNGAADYNTCQAWSAGGYLSFNNPANTECDRIYGTWHAYYGYWSSDQGSRPAVVYGDGSGVSGNIGYAANGVTWCQADMYSGVYGTGSVYHLPANSSGNATGYSQSLGWNC